MEPHRRLSGEGEEMTGLLAAVCLAAFGMFSAFVASVCDRDDTAIFLLVLFSLPLGVRLTLMAILN